MKKHKLIPEYQDNLKHVLKHFQFIDGVFGIWLGRTDGEWEQMKHDYNDFEVLKWVPTLTKGKGTNELVINVQLLRRCLEAFFSQASTSRN